MLALQHFFTQAPVQSFQVAGALCHAHFQLAAGLGFKGDTLQIMSAPLHHQTDQQHDHQQCGAPNGQHGAYGAVDQGARREDVDAPAGLVDVLGLYQPVAEVQVQRLRVAGRVGQDGKDRLLFLL